MNPELILNQQVSQFFVTATNTVIPVSNVLFESFYENVVEIATSLYQYLFILIQTFSFIVKEAINEININLTFTEKVLLALFLYNFVAVLLAEVGSVEKHHKLNAELVLTQTRLDATQTRLEATEKELQQIKKADKQREVWEEFWTEEIRKQDRMTNLKIVKAESQIKKLKKELNQYI